MDVRRTVNAEPEQPLFTLVSHPASPEMSRQQTSSEPSYWKSALDNPKHLPPSSHTTETTLNCVDDLESLEIGDMGFDAPHLLPQRRRFDGMCCLPKCYSPL